MFKKKSTKPPATFNESFNSQADRFFRMFKITAASKMVMTGVAVIAVGFSFYNLYDNYMETEGNRTHIAVIKITGEMGSGSRTGDGVEIAQAISKAYNNPNVRAVLIEAESGGGGPSDAILIYRKLQELHNPKGQIKLINAGGFPSTSNDPSPDLSKVAAVKKNVLSILGSGVGQFNVDDRTAYKPVIVSVKTICASACYYAASAADAIYADSNALIGSIGVRMEHWDVSKVMDTVGVRNETLIAGEFKNALDPYRPLTATTREFMQDEILDGMHKSFISDVEAGRKGKIVSPEEAQSIGLYSGKIWMTPTAIKYGLIDADVTTVELRERLSTLYGTDKFKVYNEAQRNLRSALGMFASLASSLEYVNNTLAGIESSSSTSTPTMR
ncbi:MULTISPECIES: S49 family peptidase [Buttiauxella]|jgi:protease-4|uniref:Protease 4 n=1 Tax=Buttiauxella agrestis TaxID=82977 RepID=A0A381KQW3_9ENTR|nr:S49 family peptidase [Buttiauxella agrestis]SUY92886.1 Protease 4 [Buttiauxella agrestis]